MLCQIYLGLFLYSLIGPRWLNFKDHLKNWHPRCTVWRIVAPTFSIRSVTPNLPIWRIVTLFFPYEELSPHFSPCEELPPQLFPYEELSPWWSLGWKFFKWSDFHRSVLLTNGQTYLLCRKSCHTIYWRIILKQGNISCYCCCSIVTYHRMTVIAAASHIVWPHLPRC